ncbi:MAG: efflux RND transporter permease subunit [bacterium]|nr:efflux RND transporter permease subunit [bacterium]
MYIADISIKRPLFVGVIVLILALFGLICLTRLPIDLMPNVDIPYVTIVTAYPGVGPTEIESLISKPIEDAISPIGGIKKVFSYSRENSSIVVAEFELGTDINGAVADVRDKVSAVRGTLPQDIDDPSIARVDINAQPIMNVTLFSKGSLAETRKLADDNVKERLQKINGVASVDVVGGLEREIDVRVDQGRLDAYGLGLAQVVAALKGDNLNVPGGRIDQRSREYTIRTVGEFTSVEQISSINLATIDGTPLTLGDVATVEDTFKEVRQKARFNGENCVTMVIKKQSGANTVKVADTVRKAVAEISGQLPYGNKLDVIVDNSTFIRDSVKDVRDNLLLGILLTVLVIFLFLRSIRSTFIIFMSIPASLIATFAFIYYSGFTLNVLSLMGLALAVGMLVDDSIVVLENIYRHFERDGNAAEAASSGTSEIGGAVVATTFTIMAVFVPIAFMKGMVGQIFKEFGLTVAFSILISLFISFTLVPTLAARLLHRENTDKDSAWDRFYNRLERAYKGALSWALSHRWLVVGIAAASLVASLMLLPIIGGEAFPFVDRGEITAYVEMPTGASLELTDKSVNEMERYLRSRKDTEIAYAEVGTSGSRQASIFIKLRKGHKQDSRKIADELRRKFSTIPGATVSVQTASMGGGGEASASGTAPVQIKISGPDSGRLTEIANRVEKDLSGIEGLIGIGNTMNTGKPELQIKVDRRLAEDRRISPGQVAATIYTAMTGDVATRFKDGGEEYDVLVRLREEDRQRLEGVKNLLLINKNDETVRVGEIADILPSGGPAEINRENRQRLAKVYAGLDSNYNIGQVNKKIKAKLSDLKLPDGYTISYGGEAEDMKEIFTPMIQAMILAVLLVYLGLVALYESLIYPLVIMFAVPLAGVGAFVLMLLAGKTMNMMSLIGLIMLAGIVTKNAILLVDYTNTLRDQGYGREEALLQAGPIRLRPILMTTLATILGMLPLALGMGEGGGLRSPMAIAVIGGLITSTLLTLLVIPVVYTLLDRRKDTISLKVQSPETEVERSSIN